MYIRENGVIRYFADDAVESAKSAKVAKAPKTKRKEAKK